MTCKSYNISYPLHVNVSLLEVRCKGKFILIKLGCNTSRNMATTGLFSIFFLVIFVMFFNFAFILLDNFDSPNNFCNSVEFKECLRCHRLPFSVFSLFLAAAALTAFPARSKLNKDFLDMVEEALDGLTRFRGLVCIEFINFATVFFSASILPCSLFGLKALLLPPPPPPLLLLCSVVLDLLSRCSKLVDSVTARSAHMARCTTRFKRALRPIKPAAASCLGCSLSQSMVHVRPFCSANATVRCSFAWNFRSAVPTMHTMEHR